MYKLSLLLIIVGGLIFETEGFLGGLRRTCNCKAVSDTVHFPFHTWRISSCTFCSCNHAAMANCEQACQDMVRNYAKTGCGKTISGSKTVYKSDASGCRESVGKEVYTCA
ncbi:unnamed protein product [Adineta steineri]|uniref:Uncharacterized protein n=1 Tax=Adineta steineri TaxID=433720 RepID=A0A814RDA1_9BILA|nr:unnamed protein product [Adineta steineri]CAF1195466.1 unnamed protein product [Adineta steineri]CAF1201130.1 unnamed protein product [Adineta steineri]